MKKIQKILLMVITLLMAGLQTSCTDYQDEIDALDVRVTVLENLVKQLNLDLSSMRTIVDVIEKGDYITNVTQNEEGCIITFGKHGAIIIKNGKDGKDGVDAEMPDISVAKDSDGVWYWTLNGEWILGPNGSKVRADGRDGRDGKDGVDGEDGKDGKDGKDAISPKVRINANGYWEISVDGGTTWVNTGTPAGGADGKDGKDGRDGKDGKDGKDGVDGKDGNEFFESVTLKLEAGNEYMVIVTKGGSTFIIPIYQKS